MNKVSLSLSLWVRNKNLAELSSRRPYVQRLDHLLSRLCLMPVSCFTLRNTTVSDADEMKRREGTCPASWLSLWSLCGTLLPVITLVAS